MAWMKHDSDQGTSSVQYYPVRQPLRSYETAVSLAQGRVVRIESNAPPSPQNLEFVDTFREGVTNGYILGRDYAFNLFTFGGFFSPDEWAFEYNAYAWQGEEFAIDGSTLCPSYPIELPCHDDYWLDFDFFRNTPLYHNLFLSEWCDLGSHNGIRGTPRQLYPLNHQGS